MIFKTANRAWLLAIDDIRQGGASVEPQKSTGGGGRATFEIRNHKVDFAMAQPVVLCKPNTSWLYMASEVVWILNGKNDLKSYPEIAKIQAPYSDNDLTLNGAYGPAYASQIEYIIKTLDRDRNSRQAVMTIWKRNPKPSKDIPCTCLLQFMIRNNIIHTSVYMRSSDVSLGLPYDMFSFTCMTAEIASRLGTSVELGMCTITAGSRHIYLEQAESLFKLVNEDFGVAMNVPEYPLWETWKWPAKREKLEMVASLLTYGEEDRRANQQIAKNIILGI